MKSNRSDRGQNRVVVSGFGVVGPGISNTGSFLEMLQSGRSGIAFLPQLEKLGFECQVGGIAVAADIDRHSWYDYFDLEHAADFIQLACMAGLEAWESAQLHIPPFDRQEIDWETGLIIGSGFSGIDIAADRVIPHTNAGHPKKIGSYGVQHTMGSGAAAQLSAILGIGNQVTANSSACCTGTEAILEGYYRIRNGLADRMVVGSVEGFSPYIWAQFDAARVLNRKHNDKPGHASRPMSASARGFVPSSGAGVIVLESIESAVKRNAPVYAELLGGACNSGGQRGSGSMTFPNNQGVRRCIRQAVQASGIQPADIDLISGHLTGTKADPVEVENWLSALELPGSKFPMINAPKSMFGHALAGSGALESVACILQLLHGFVHPSTNCEDPHPAIVDRIPGDRIPQNAIPFEALELVIKASFGFGDVNSCLLFRRWHHDQA